MESDSITMFSMTDLLGTTNVYKNIGAFHQKVDFFATSLLLSIVRLLLPPLWSSLTAIANSIIT